MSFKQNYRLRKPGGKYTVGCMKFEYEYESEDTKSKRRIPCLCFYPSSESGDSKDAKEYASSRVFPGFSGIYTNSYWDIPVLAGKHPFLLFSTGLGSYLEQNTVQFEELASNGYIVLSIGHEGSTSFELKNGEICLWDSQEAYVEENKNSQEKIKPYKKWFEENSNAASVEEKRHKYLEYVASLTYRTPLLDIWVKDGLVTLERLFDSNDEESARIRTHIDREKVAAFGMSFGGSMAFRLAVESDFIKAGVSMDSTIYWTPDWEGTIDKPFMSIHADSLATPSLKDVMPLLSPTSDFYSVTIRDCSHVNFTDYSEILEVDENRILGSIDPDVMERIMSTLILDFFNKYFKPEPSEYLDTGFWDDYAVVSKR